MQFKLIEKFYLLLVTMLDHYLLMGYYTTKEFSFKISRNIMVGKG